LVADDVGYSARFYDLQRNGSSRSARIMLPIVFSELRPRSVIDVGCGVGTWLQPARELGADRTVGLDGEWVRAFPVHSSIDIRHAQFEEPIELAESFDLALCLEVAEHLSPMRARGLVADLTRLAPHVLFSAAIPRQGGHLHLNEQWQSYWANLFAAEGYGARDIVRPRVRWSRGVEFWYRQNAILYSRGAPIVDPETLNFVHPYQRLAWGISATRAVLRSGTNGRGRGRGGSPTPDGPAGAGARP
jgi:SAM-dependent methyltransferase